MEKPKTIVFLSEMPATNGVIQAQLLPVVFAAANQGYKTYLIETIGRFDSQEKQRESVEKEIRKNETALEKIKVPRYTFLPSILYFSAKTYSLVKKIAKNNPDSDLIIYARNYKFAPLLAWLGIPFVYSPRGAYVAERKYYKKTKDLLYGNLIGYFEKKAIQKSEMTILETDHFKKHLENIYKIADSNLKVIPNYYNHSLALNALNNRKQMRKKLGYENKKVIVYAGTIEIWYEFEKMFDLVSRLKKNNPDIFFQLFVKEDYARNESIGMAQKLSSIAARFNLKENYDYGISSYPPDERYQYLSACDAGICLTTPQEFKTMMLYLKIVDYLGAGLPIIINSEVKSTVEIIKNSGTGAIVDYKDWSNSISKIEIEKLFERSGVDMSQYEKFSSKNILPEYLDLFDRVFEKIKNK